MSETYMKARVLLLDKSTGDPIGECEIISDSREIFYSNEKPMPESKGNIPAGTTFDKTSLASIMDDLLYDKTNPSFKGGLSFSNGDASYVTNDIIVIKPKGSIVEGFNATISVDFGSHDDIDISLVKITNGKQTKETIHKTRTTTATTMTTVTFNIPSFYEDTDIYITVEDGTDFVTGPKVEYKFVSPIWIGWVRSDVIIPLINELDKGNAALYMQELINHNSKNLQKKFVYKSNQQAYIVPNINYNTREQLSPCILIPQTWGELKKITDTNGNNITNSYAKLVGIDINTHGSYIEHYILYVLRCVCANDSEIIKGITYVTDNSANDIFSDNIVGDGTPVINSTNVLNNVPLDSRSYVKTYQELLEILYPYPGLNTYVEDINTTFRFEKGHWVPFNNKTHVVESYEELTEDLGGWDDLAINTMDGLIWKKRYNNQWERYGDIEKGSIVYNDYTLGNGLHQFNYIGNWREGDGGVGHYYGNNHWSNTPGDYLSFKFHGTSLKYYCSKEYNLGIASFSIDGSAGMEIDLFKRDSAFNQLVYETGTLPEGDHELIVSVTGKKNTESADCVIVADKIKVYE